MSSPFPNGTVKFPDGSIDVDNLADLLFKAAEDELKSTDIVQVLVHERVKGFMPEIPNYETVKVPLTVKRLREWYKTETGIEFNPKTHRESRVFSETVVAILINPLTGGSHLVDIGS